MNTAHRPLWHAITTAEVRSALHAPDEGLSDAEADGRLRQYGPNVIPRGKPLAAWRVFARQFQSPLIYILGVAAIVSMVIGHSTDAGFIAAVVLVNALVGGYQEFRAERSAQALQQLLRIRAIVIRNGEARELDADLLVPGDLIRLESGNRVPADVRLLTEHGLEVDESLLTGESVAVDKDANAVLPQTTVVADRRNMAFAGSMVARGRAGAIVVETGSRTQIGELARDVLSAPAGKPPLILRLERFTRLVGVSVLVAAAGIAVLGVAVQHYGWGEMFMFAVALAVSAIPEGLPIAITVALAVGATRMARRGVIVRKLGAVEGLGSCTLIASDKTGTLTCNELTARELSLADGERLEVTGQGFAPAGSILRNGGVVERGESASLDALCMAAVLCNEADLYLRDGQWRWRGDPTDVALLSMAHKLGWRRELTLDKHPQCNEIPFEPEIRFAATFNKLDVGTGVFVKGAPERVLPMCDLDPPARSTFAERAEEMAARGFRVLGIASGAAPDGLSTDSAPPEPTGLTFLGFVGMIDPLRSGAAEAVEVCGRAGISVSMVTGDHPTTALAVARELGLADSLAQVVTGDALAGSDPDSFREKVGRSRVFARVAPGQKLSIVAALERRGHLVAVTGDGANDAPALRAANIGVAMGRSGTDVAREASDLVISDDNFATIVAGVEEGRIAYDNIRKVIFLLICTGAAEVILIALAVATGSPLPLLPAQLLWLNLVTNGIQDVALAFEPGEADVLLRRPRPPRERIFNSVMVRNCLFSAAVMGLMGFAAYKWMLNAGWTEASSRNGLLLLMVLFENVLIGNCRCEIGAALGLSPLRSPLLLLGAVSAFLVHVAAMHFPIGQQLLKTEPVGGPVWIAFGAMAVCLFALVELHKWAWRISTERSASKCSV
ncbi:MAG: HAD-IC family P-type ATPase [Phycisphaerales bacterium]|nr:HAD-IC family P-type ATPase [Phycisphaerales bacterium]